MESPLVTEYRRRRNLAWFAFLGYVPICFGVGVLSIRLFSTSTPAFVVAIAWMFFLSSREISLCASPAQDVGSRFLKSGGITTALRGGASTVACRSMPTRAPQIVNECKRLFSTVVLLGSYSRY